MFLYKYVVPHDTRYSSMVAAGIASLALPGFERFLHAFLLADFCGPDICFYTAKNAAGLSINGVRPWTIE
jgi:hypothetical protein